MEFSCTATQAAGRVTLTVAGEVDLSTHTRFQSQVAQSWNGSTDLVIDCSGVTFMDSMGLRVLVHAMQRASANGRYVTLAAPSQPVVQVLDLTGVRSLFTETGAVAEEADSNR